MGNPTVTPLSEQWHDGGFLVSEANGHFSRDEITLLSGVGKVQPGTLLGQITTGATATSAALGTNVGNGVMGTVTPVSVPTRAGIYDVTFTAATAFTVTAPDGETATGTTGNAFSALGIGFTITAGGTPMVAGDGFNITITQAVGKPTAAAVAKSGNTGNATSSAVTTTGYAPIVGVYTLTFARAVSDLGTFVVTDPNGQQIGHGVVGTAFSAGGIGFTLADGATDFVGGDQFAITVVAGSAKWKPWDGGNADGSQNAAGILFGYRDATSADKKAVAIVRNCEVNASELVYPSGTSATQITAALAQLKLRGIIAR